MDQENIRQQQLLLIQQMRDSGRPIPPGTALATLANQIANTHQPLAERRLPAEPGIFPQQPLPRPEPGTFVHAVDEVPAHMTSINNDAAYHSSDEDTDGEPEQNVLNAPRRRRRRTTRDEETSDNDESATPNRGRRVRVVSFFQWREIDIAERQRRRAEQLHQPAENNEREPAEDNGREPAALRRRRNP